MHVQNLIAIDGGQNAVAAGLTGERAHHRNGVREQLIGLSHDVVEQDDPRAQCESLSGNTPQQTRRYELSNVAIAGGQRTPQRRADVFGRPDRVVGIKKVQHRQRTADGLGRTGFWLGLIHRALSMIIIVKIRSLTCS
jgi:hypothetical protein